MVMLALALLAAQPADELRIPVCTLVTPGGDNVGFFIWSDGAENEVNLTSTTGSVWPSGTVVARRPDSSDGVQFLIGGSAGFILELARPSASGGPRLATLMRNASSRNTYPVAVGVCQDAPPPREPSPPRGDSVGIDNPAFDPARWPDDCAMITSRREIVRFDYTIAGPRGPVRLESPSLWNAQPLNVRFVNVPDGNSRFGGETGPAGSERLLGTGNVRAKIIAFSRLGDPATPAQTGIGICGYNHVVRRPNVQ